MPKTPADDETGFYHVVIPLDPLHEGGGEIVVDAEPVTEERANELIRLFQRIGRNQPCPCGSGVKFKKCCLRRAS
jgi:protein O-GlcNAc transferase